MPAPDIIDINDAIGSAIAGLDFSAVEAEAKGDEPASPPAEQPADEPEPEDEGEETEGEHAEGEEEGEEGPTIPEGFAAVPAITDALATEFTVRDAEGEIEIPDIMIAYKANGKVRTDRLDQVVRLAQWGVYNHEREQRFTHVEAEHKTLQSTLAEREQQMERLLTDDDYLFAVRDAWEEQNTPEKRVERAEARVTSLQVEQEMRDIHAAGNTFAEVEVLPAIGMIAAALPHITEDELYEKFEMALRAQAEEAPDGSTYIPASRFDAVRKYIVEDLAVWARYHNAQRANTQPTVSPRPAAKAKDETELHRARVEAQRAKRIIGTTLTPAGRADSGKNAAVKTGPTLVTVDDAFGSAMDAVLAAVR